MKKLFISIFVLLICKSGVCQYPINQSIGSPVTMVTSKGGLTATETFVIPTYFDTATANVSLYTKFYTGSCIFTTVDSSFWCRLKNVFSQYWFRIGGAGGGATGSFWSLQGNFVNPAPANFGLGTTDGFNSLRFITNNTTRAYIPLNGFVLSNDTTVNKIFTWNPSTKDWGYANWNNGGSSTTDWSITGNAGTVAGTNFLGTTDNIDLVFKRNSTIAGRIGLTNTSFGVSSLISITSGTNNTAFGFQAGFTNIIGISNTAIGYQALHNSTASINTAVGFQAMAFTTTGDANAAFGVNALITNTTGFKNTAIGAGAMEDNTTGFENTFVGEDAGLNITTAALNNGVGWLSGSGNLTGNQNNYFGASSGRSQTAGSNNIFIGHEAGFSGSQLANVTNSIALGASTFTTKSNQMVLGNTSLTETIINGIPYTLSTTRKKILLKDTVTGVVENIDPALITGVNIYNSNGSLTGTRVVDLGTNSVTFISTAYPSGLYSIDNTNGAFQIGDFNADVNGTYIVGNDAAGLISYSATNGHTFSGNVGIGAGSPTRQLDVTGKSIFRDSLQATGAVRFSGISAGNGKVLQSDANGNATWTTPSTVATAVPINGLTAATATNDIDNTTFRQIWRWTGNNTPAIDIVSASNVTTANTYLFGMALTGANPNPSTNSNGLSINNSRTGTTSTNTAAAFTSSSATTNVGATFGATGGTNNYAITVAPSQGDVGIGTAQPTSKLHVIPVQTTGIGAEFISSTTTSGTILDITGTSTVLAANNEGLNIGISGANGTNAIEATGLRISVTNTNATSGTNTGINVTASGAATANYAIKATGAVDITGTTTFNNSNVSGNSNVYNAQTGTTYTLVAADNGKIVTLSNGSAITLTVPASLPAGFNCTLVQIGAGQVTIAASSTTINNQGGFTKIKGQYAAVTILQYTTNTFITQGNME